MPRMEGASGTDVDNLLEGMSIRSSRIPWRGATLCLLMAMIILLGLAASVLPGRRQVSGEPSFDSAALSMYAEALQNANLTLRGKSGSELVNQSWFLHGGRHLVPEIEKPDFTRLTDLRHYWESKARQMEESSPDSTTTEEYLRVSRCMCAVSLCALKLTAALLALDAAIDVCPKIEMLPDEEDEVNWVTRRVAGRRLAPGVVIAAGVKITSKRQAQMACAANINGFFSGLTGAIQYAASIVTQCPKYVSFEDKQSAGCTEALGVLISGITKSGAALSDIQYQCRDPATTPYTSPIDKKRQGIITAACVVNCGQAASYLGKIGLTVDGIARNCPLERVESDFFLQGACLNSVASHFVAIGQVATYLAAAANGCGKLILNPFGCTNRVAATVTGFADVVEGSGKIIIHCLDQPTPTKSPALPQGDGKKIVHD